MKRYLDTVEVWGSSPHGPCIFDFVVQRRRINGAVPAGRPPRDKARHISIRAESDCVLSPAALAIFEGDGAG
jgi:hypothetical protein